MPLSFSIEVDDNGSPRIINLNRNLANTTTTSEKLSKGLKIAGASIAAAGAAAAAAAGTVFALTKRVAESQDRIGKFAERIGFSVEGLTQLRFAAEKTGVDGDKLNIAMQRLTRRLAEARAGSGTAKVALEEMGRVLGKDIVNTGRSSEETLSDIADAMKKIEDPAKRTSLAFKLFDTEGVALVNTLKDGSEGLNKLKAEASALGATFDREAAENSAKFNDTLLEVTSTADGIFRSVMNEVMPGITIVLEDLRDTIVENKDRFIDFANTVVKMSLKITPVFTKLLDLAGKIAKQLTPEVDFSDLDKELEDMELKAGNFGKKIISIEEQRRKDAQQKLKDIQAEKDFLAKKRKAEQDAENARKKTEQERKRAADQFAKDKEKFANIFIKLDSDLADLSKKAFEESQQRDKQFLETKKNISREIQLENMNAHDRQIALLEEEFKAREFFLGKSVELEENFNNKILEARKEKRLQDMANIEENLTQVANVLSQGSNVLDTIRQGEQTRINNRFDENKEAIEEEYTLKINRTKEGSKTQARIIQARDEKLKQLEDQRQKKIRESERKTAGIRKTLAIGEATINGAVAFTKALTLGIPFGPIAAALTAVQTAAQVGLIASQKFETGGFPVGKNAIIQVNENGQESVLNAGATRFLGREGVDALNSGNTDNILNLIAENTGSSKGGGVKISINGGMVDRNFVENELIPMIKQSTRRF